MRACESVCVHVCAHQTQTLNMPFSQHKQNSSSYQTEWQLTFLSSDLEPRYPPPCRSYRNALVSDIYSRHPEASSNRLLSEHYANLEYIVKQLQCTLYEMPPMYNGLLYHVYVSKATTTTSMYNGLLEPLLCRAGQFGLKIKP